MRESVPGPTGPTGPDPDAATLVAAAASYLDRGWRLFAVRATKTPLPNCDECRRAGPGHDPAACGHPTCHGFYAATRDLGRLAAVLAAPGLRLAVRTGTASGVAVLDFEAAADSPDLPTGLEVADGWESWTGGLPLPPTAPRARTRSGGLHVFVSCPAPLRSVNRILPGTDLKADGGYVVLPPDPGRRWLTPAWPEVVPGPSPGLRSWLADPARGRRGGRAGTGTGTGEARGPAPGYDFERFHREGCPVGVRDDYFNDLLFRLRRAGTDLDRALVAARDAWLRAAQPRPGSAAPRLEWEHVLYKVARVWRTVEPALDPADVRATWAREAAAAARPEPEPAAEPGVRRLGRLSLAATPPRRR